MGAELMPVDTMLKYLRNKPDMRMLEKPVFESYTAEQQETLLQAMRDHMSAMAALGDLQTRSNIRLPDAHVWARYTAEQKERLLYAMYDEAAARRQLPQQVDEDKAAQELERKRDQITDLFLAVLRAENTVKSHAMRREALPSDLMKDAMTTYYRSEGILIPADTPNDVLAEDYARLQDARARYSALQKVSDERRRVWDARLDTRAFLELWLTHAPDGRKPFVQRALDLFDGVADDTQTQTQTYTGSKVARKVKGVSYVKSRDKWRAQVMEDGKRVSLGMFDTEDDAKAAVLAYRPTDFGGFVGIDRHGRVMGAWALRYPVEQADMITEYLNRLDDYDDVKHPNGWTDCYEVIAPDGSIEETYALYRSKQAAALSYDRYAREYLDEPRLNYPEIGERDAQGKIRRS